MNTLAVVTLAFVVSAPPDEAAFFEKKVRPILVQRCVECHGPDKQKGGLRVDSRAALLTGGGRGAAVALKKPDESLFLRALSHGDELKMPPKNKLSAQEIATLTEWVRAGAPWPESSLTPISPSMTVDRAFSAEEKAYWAFQPVKRPTVPKIDKPAFTVRNPIDNFILAKLNAAKLKPTGEADRHTLLRRVTFDLTGLPPTPEETDAFLKDESPQAYEKLVDRLLASTAYGEKWGRRWLDVARYADSNGMDENLAYVNAWRYRDYVIKSFNDDKPYDQFVREQIAGDLLNGKSEAEKAEGLIATGFLVIGPKMLAEDDPVKMRMDIIDEQLDAIGQAFMGLTLGCARCHDHKFDPVTQADYYGLAGLLYSTKTMQNHKVVAVWNERSLGTAKDAAALAEHEKKVAAAKAEVATAEKEKKPADELKRLREAVKTLEKARPRVDEAMAVEDAKGEDLRIHLRGSHLTLGDSVPRRFPRILAGDKALSLGADRSGRREFAEWLTNPAHPLTARVMVNRLWLGHFGSGIVSSPDNFGRLGERPTHPELLDWLAAEFVEAKWSVKHMHRLMVTSTAYRSHSNRRRLDAEEIRDAMLAVSGLLDRKMGGTLLTSGPRQYVTGTGNRNYEGYSHPRRSVYLPVIRSAVYDVLQTLDFPDPSVPNGQRPTTTVPAQALFMLNSAVADQTAEAFAKVILAVKGDDAERVREAYRRAFGRAPTARELEKVNAYLKKSQEEATRLQAWRGLCRVLLASNEFVFVE